MIYLFKACFYRPACTEHNALFTTQYCGLYFENMSSLGFHKICSKYTDQIEKDIFFSLKKTTAIGRMTFGDRQVIFCQ